MDIYTQRVIFWLDQHEYSRQHWDVVAKETYDECDKDLGKAVEELAKGLYAFHKKYQDGVVKPGNVLHELIEMGLAKVDWEAAARSRYKSYDS